MIMVNNPFGQDPMDINEETAADRVGARIRAIRMARGLSQTELGEKVGLNADRVQKYENGVRKPKADMLKQFATALGVSTLALTDPVITNHIGAMYALFEMENQFKVKVEKAPDDRPPGFYISIDFKNDMYKYMEEWYKVYTTTQSQLEMASSDAEREEILKSYFDWEWNFPKGIVERSEKNLQKAQLKRKIEELQEAYNQLDKE